MLLSLFFLPLSTDQHKEPKLPTEVYAWWGDGTVESRDIFMNLSKSKRDSIAIDIYERNYDRWVEQRYGKNNTDVRVVTNFTSTHTLLFYYVKLKFESLNIKL